VTRRFVRRIPRSYSTHVVTYCVHSADRTRVGEAWSSVRHEVANRWPDTVSVRLLESMAGSTLIGRLTLIVECSEEHDAGAVTQSVAEEICDRFDLASNRCFTYIESVQKMCEVRAGSEAQDFPPLRTVAAEYRRDRLSA
jgi:hypothetical protein